MGLTKADEVAVWASKAKTATERVARTFIIVYIIIELMINNIFRLLYLETLPTVKIY